MNYREALERLIPEHMRHDVDQYIRTGFPQGDFLNCIFENDLVHAYGRADHINFEAIPRYADFLYNYAPLDCWGSREKRIAWQQAGGLEGLAKAREETP